MRTALITPPAEEPVALQEFADHARIDIDPERIDDMREKLLAGRTHIESEAKRVLITSTWRAYLECWPRCRCLPRCRLWPHCSYLELDWGNLQSVASVKYRISTGEEKVWSPSKYRLSRVYDPATGPSDAGIGRIYPAYGETWPSEALDVGEPISIDYVCGWKDAASVPAMLKAGVELAAAHFWLHREAVTLGNTAVESKDLIRGVDSCIARYADLRH
jgi:uncharacterized phiE125 gp8 family phage protein